MAKHERPKINFVWIVLLVVVLASDTTVHLNAQEFPLDQYLGCFYANEIRGSFAENQTVEACIRNCTSIGTQSYAKLQNGTLCECVNEYGLQDNDSLCDIRCRGNKAQHCGGSKSSLSAYVLYTVCPIGTYGSRCNESCHCERQMPCDRQTGNCSNGCHANYTGATCNELDPVPEQLIGCYRDKNTERVMIQLADKTTKNSFQFCAHVCSSENYYSYTGTQFGHQCFCGESYAKHGELNHSDCNYICSGNRQEFCGGANAISVYHTCPTGFYGRYCSKVCNCEVGRCEIRNGTCPNVTCKSGWKGAACNQRDCSIKNGACSSDELCVHVQPIESVPTSVCRRCSRGFERKSVPTYSCTDIDECAKNRTICGPYGSCSNTEGGYLCHCRNNDTVKDSPCRADALQNQYLGCFYKGEGNNTVSVLLGNVSLTVKDCLKFCNESNTTFARLLNETYCDCVDEDDDGIRNDSLCNATCLAYSDLSCTVLTRGDARAYILYTVCPKGTYGYDCEKNCSCTEDGVQCNRISGKCPSTTCDQSDSCSTSFIQFIERYLKYVGPPLVAVAILLPIAICLCRRSGNQKGDFQTKRAKIAAFLSAEIAKKKRQPPAMPDIEACEKRTPAPLSNSIGDLTTADSEISKEKDQTALIKNADPDQHKRNPKKRLKLPSPDECDFKERVTLSKQPDKDKTTRKPKKPIIPDPDQCVKIQPEHSKGADEKTKRKAKKCINPDPKVSEEKDQNETGKGEDEKAQRKTKKRALPVPKGPEEKEHLELGKTADEKTKKTKKFTALNSDKIEENEDSSTKGSTRKSNLYIFAERRTANKPASPIARENKMHPKQSKPTKECGLKSRPTPEKSADDDSDGEVYAGLENTADDGEGDVYTALETGNASNCSNASVPALRKPNRK